MGVLLKVFTVLVVVGAAGFAAFWLRPTPFDLTRNSQLTSADATMQAMLFEVPSIDAVRIERVARDTSPLEEKSVEIAIKVLSLNPVDVKTMDLPFLCRARPGHACGIGVEAAGIVVGVGSGVTRVAKGDRVIVGGLGLSSQFVRITENQVVKLPANVPLKTAATLLVIGNTANKVRKSSTCSLID